MFARLNKRGQSTLEYAVIIAVVVAGLLAMQIYVRRGLSGRYKQASDDIGDQFSPATSTSNYVTTVSTNQKETVSEADRSASTVINTNTQGRTGSETTGAIADENWQ